ncbi:unnamed protein product, partial [Callosobruchus maculatus]
MIEEGEDPDTFEFESPEFEWAKKLEAKSKQAPKTKQAPNSRNLLDCRSKSAEDGYHCSKKDIEERIGTRIDILESKWKKEQKMISRGVGKQKEDLRDNID